MERVLKIETKNFWEISGHHEDAVSFYLPLGEREICFALSCFRDEEIEVYSVGDRIVGYYQPSWRVAVFIDIDNRYHYCENTGCDMVPLLIHLKNFSNGVQWTAFMEDGDEEEIFIRLV